MSIGELYQDMESEVLMWNDRGSCAWGYALDERHALVDSLGHHRRDTRRPWTGGCAGTTGGTARSYARMTTHREQAPAPGSWLRCRDGRSGRVSGSSPRPLEVRRRKRCSTGTRSRSHAIAVLIIFIVLGVIVVLGHGRLLRPVRRLSAADASPLRGRLSRFQ